MIYIITIITAMLNSIMDRLHMYLKAAFCSCFINAILTTVFEGCLSEMLHSHEGYNYIEVPHGHISHVFGGYFSEMPYSDNTHKYLSIYS